MVTPEQAIQVVNKALGRYPGYRALHAKGILCRGAFTASSRRRPGDSGGGPVGPAGPGADPLLQRGREAHPA